MAMAMLSSRQLQVELFFLEFAINVLLRGVSQRRASLPRPSAIIKPRGVPNATNAPALRGLCLI